MLVQFNLIIDTAVTLILLIYLASILSFFRIIKQKSFVDYIVSCISLLFVLFAIYSTGVITLLHAVILLLTGLPVFFSLYKKT
jgi:hypothetical protein